MNFLRRFSSIPVIPLLAFFMLGAVAMGVSNQGGWREVPETENCWIAFDEPGPSTIYTGPDGATERCYAYIGPVMTDCLGVARRPVVMIIEYLHGKEKVGSGVCLGTPAAEGAELITSGGGPFSGASWEGTFKYYQSLGPVSGKTWGDIESEKAVKLDLTSAESPKEENRGTPLKKA